MSSAWGFQPPYQPTWPQTYPGMAPRPSGQSWPAATTPPVPQNTPAKPDNPKPDPAQSLTNLHQDADDPTKWNNYGLRQGVDYQSWRRCRDAVYSRIDRTMQYLYQIQPNWTLTLFGDEPGLKLGQTDPDAKFRSFPFNPLAATDAEMTWHGVDMLTPQDVDDAMKDEMLSVNDPRKKGYIENMLGLNADPYAAIRDKRRHRKV